MPGNLLKNLPTVTELLESPPLRAVRDRVSHSVVVGRVRGYLEDLRTQVQATATEVVLPTVTDLAQRLAQRILQTEQSRLRPVINATGLLLPPGLGCAPLAPSAIEEIVGVARDYASLELNLETGERQARSQAVEELLCELSGAEAALVVSSSHGSTIVVLAALASQREVVVARSQLLESSDGFRLTDAIGTSGALLREVGAANAARLDDYRLAIQPHTAALLLVEPEAAIATPAVTVAELTSLAQHHRVPLIYDLNAVGLLLDLRSQGVEGPLAAESIRAGADLVLCSAERSGGPEAGIIVGKRALIEQIARHPLLRAMPVDRLTLAALAATLRLLRQPNLARDTVPLLQLWTTSVENLQNRAERLAPQLAACSGIGAAEAHARSPRAGDRLASWCIALTPAADCTVQRLAATLRGGRPAVVAVEESERVLLDLRTVFPRQDQELVEAVAALVKEKSE